MNNPNMESSLWLKDKVALITGGASGLGLAVAKRFVKEGAQVAVFDNSKENLEQAATELPSSSLCIRGDVRNYPDHQSALDKVSNTFGPLDIYVGNAGVWDYGLSLIDIPEDKLHESFDEVLGVNLKGYLLGARAAIPSLVKTRGTIILTVSNAGFYVDGGGVLYTASKHAVVGLIKQLAHELAPIIRVNGVAPGAMMTQLRGPITLGMENASITDLPLEQVSQLLPMNSIPQPEECVGAYVYLASNENSAMATGTIINTDGGIGVKGIFDVSKGSNLLEKYEQ